MIACRHFLSCTSPAANTPGTLVVVVPGSVICFHHEHISNRVYNSSIPLQCAADSPLSHTSSYHLECTVSMQNSLCDGDGLRVTDGCMWRRTA